MKTILEREFAKLRREMDRIRRLPPCNDGLPMTMTRKRAAEVLGCTPRRLRFLIRTGVVLLVPVGGRMRVPASEVRRVRDGEAA